jgi:hypothetical protein
VAHRNVRDEQHVPQSRLGGGAPNWPRRGAQK